MTLAGRVCAPVQQHPHNLRICVIGKAGECQNGFRATEPRENHPAVFHFCPSFQQSLHDFDVALKYGAAQPDVTQVRFGPFGQQVANGRSMNDEKVWDIPRAVSASAKFNSVVFFVGGGCGNCEYYLANLRVATGAPDTRNKILTEGKWVTRGILFDVNSDRIKGESYGSLKEIAGVLTENADLKVQIVGHTDSDGDDAKNLDLSKRRAASVKSALSSEFKIDASRMETDGKGESQPVDKNDNPAGKANNRRVEFIKK